MENFTFEDFKKAANKIEDQMSWWHDGCKVYFIKYMWGAWMPELKIIAESDKDALEQAEEAFMKGECRKVEGFKYALTCGNRIVKRY